LTAFGVAACQSRQADSIPFRHSVHSATDYVALPFVVSYDGSAPSGVVTIGDFAARRIDLD
jgi:hypothetical protein